MNNINVIQAIVVAIISAGGTIAVAWFTLKGQLKTSKVTQQQNDNSFIVELQRQLSVEREQMNEQRLQDTRSIADNMKMMVSMQEQMNGIQNEVADWRKKYFELDGMYQRLQIEHSDLQQKFSNLKGQLTRMKNEK